MIRRTLLRFVDAVELILGRRPDLLPPRHLRDVGPGDFFSIGQEFFGYFRTLCDLRPSERVLDVGCGIGRMAVPLTSYLQPDGAYEGFDIVPSAVRWCQRNISRRFPNFRFHLADLRNRRYNRRGTRTAASYSFPFPDETFDFAFLTSVFTHMLPAEVENYSNELKRVVRPGGRLLATFFLLNEESESFLDAGRGSLAFPHGREEHALMNSAVPEAAVAYREDWLRELLERCGLLLREPIRYGGWCGRERFTSFQDMVVADRP